MSDTGDGGSSVVDETPAIPDAHEYGEEDSQQDEHGKEEEMEEDEGVGDNQTSQTDEEDEEVIEVEENDQGMEEDSEDEQDGIEDERDSDEEDAEEEERFGENADVQEEGELVEETNENGESQEGDENEEPPVQVKQEPQEIEDTPSQSSRIFCSNNAMEVTKLTVEKNMSNNSDTSAPPSPRITRGRAQRQAAEPPRYDPERQAVTLKDMLLNMLEQFANDIRTAQLRYEEIRAFLIAYFGTDENGVIFDTFDDSDYESSTPMSFFSRRYRPQGEKSVIDMAMEKRKRRGDSLGHSSASSGSSEPVRRGSEKKTRKEPKVLEYPFVSRFDEEKIYKNCGNIASTYAQRLSKVLFVNSLHLYFKDQDPQKRDWLHKAVDYRFPTSDKYNHAIKWKNCSNAINKNMREYNKGKKESTKEIKYTYLTKEQEEDCFARAGSDPNKYGEYMSWLLFEGSWNKFFKEQDQTKKDWLRECLDIRYPIDKEKSSARWKICAAACNRNRTKILGQNGEVNNFPYFPQSIEEECFGQAKGVPSAYAEALSRRLFPDTPHLTFKEQDLGKRNWLHHWVDHRFPTPNKEDQNTKWKSCTQAINRNRNDTISVVPSPPSKTSSKVEKNSRTRRSGSIKKEEEDEETTEPENKRPRRAIKETVKMQESHIDTSPTTRNKTAQKNGLRSSKVETVAYTRYPFVSKEKEIEIYENCNNNTQIYAKKLGRVLFEDSLQFYYKDQDPDRRSWMREIVDFRFPSSNAGDQKQKWKNVCAAINKNMSFK